MCIDVLIFEYFKAKSIPLDTIPFIRLPNTNVNKQIALFKGGMAVIKMVGRGGGGYVGDLPLEAKLVNRTLTANVFKYSDGERIKKHNMNGVTILMENFGDVSLMWMVPVPTKLFEYLLEGVHGLYSYYQYVNHGFMFDVRTHPNENPTPAVNKEEITLFFKSLETFLSTEFIHLLINNFSIIGSENSDIYVKDKEGKIFVIKYLVDEDLKDKMVELSDYSIKRINEL